MDVLYNNTTEIDLPHDGLFRAQKGQNHADIFYINAGSLEEARWAYSQYVGTSPSIVSNVIGFPMLDELQNANFKGFLVAKTPIVENVAKTLDQRVALMKAFNLLINRKTFNTTKPLSIPEMRPPGCLVARGSNITILMLD